MVKIKAVNHHSDFPYLESEFEGFVESFNAKKAC